MNNLNKYAPILVRFTIAAVLMWFGVNQFMHPEMWTRVVPAWGAGMFGGTANAIMFNAWFEVIFALILVMGIQTRIVGLILAIHIGVIASGFGTSPTAIRDYGLALTALSIFFAGADIWTLDRKLAARKVATVPNQQ